MSDPIVQRLREAYELAVASGDRAALARVREQMRIEAPRYRRRMELREEYPSFGTRVAIAAGKEATDLMRGAGTLARRLAASATGGDPEAIRDRAAAEQAAADVQYEPMRQIDPVANLVGSAIPYAAGVARTVPQMALEGAAFGAAQAGTEELPEVMVSAGTGAILDPVAAKAVDALTGVARGGGRPDHYAQETFRRGQQLGFKVPASKVTGNQNIGRIEAGLESGYMTGGHIEDLKAGNEARLNEIAAESIGQPPRPEFTPGVLNAAHEDLGARYDKLLEGRVFMDVVPAMRESMQRLMDESAETAQRWLPGEFADDIFQKVSRGLDRIEQSGGTLSGKAYQNISSHLASEARKAFRQEGGYDRGFMISQIRDALDRAIIDEAVRQDTLGRSPAFMGQTFEGLPDVVRRGSDNLEFAEELNDLRKSWRNLTMLEAPNVVRGTRVSAPTLSNVLNRKDETGYKRGRNTSDLYDAVRFGAFYPDVVGTSGTAERGSLAQEAALIGQGIMSGASVFGASGGNPTLAGLAVAAPWAYRQGHNAVNALQTKVANFRPGLLQSGPFGLGDLSVIDPMGTVLRQAAKGAALQDEDPIYGLLGQ